MPGHQRRWHEDVSSGRENSAISDNQPELVVTVTGPTSRPSTMLTDDAREKPRPLSLCSWLESGGLGAESDGSKQKEDAQQRGHLIGSQGAAGRGLDTGWSGFWPGATAATPQEHPAQIYPTEARSLPALTSCFGLADRK